MGSGLVTFSRFPILQVFFKRYTLNGEPHRIFHGDYFTGKGVGACRILLPSGAHLDLYNTHLHAEYDCHTNFYMVHRMCQLQELVQFVELSSRAESLVIVVGDLNTIPESFPYQVLVAKQALSEVSPLVDAWQLLNRTLGGRIVRAKDWDGEDLGGFTYNLPENSYYNEEAPIEKLDYVLVGARPGVAVLDAGVLAKDKVLGSAVSLSDHCLVHATVRFDPAGGPAVPSKATPMAEKLAIARDAVDMMREEILRVKDLIRFCHALAFALLAVFLATLTTTIVLFVTDTLSVGVLFGLFCLQPLVLAGFVLALAMARLWMQEQIAALIAFKREWCLFILANEAPSRDTDGIDRVDC